MVSKKMKRIQIWANGVYFVLCFGLLVYFLPSITVDENGLFSAEFTSINRSYELGKSERKTVPELINSYGYPCENHQVVTKDEYLLTLHRIPIEKYERNDDSENPREKKRTPVFLGHSVVGSSAIWSFSPNHSLAYKLVDEGYDVWMINIRGTSYSRKHLSLEACISCEKYWNFSHHETALEDYSASIDYVLKETNSSEVFFVGYSMATAQYLMLLSEKTEYNKKIKGGFLLGPSVFGKYNTNPLTFVSPYAEKIEYIVNAVGLYDVTPRLFLEVQAWFVNKLCSPDSTICSYLYASFVGMDPKNMDPSLAAIFLNHLPDATNSKTMVHMAQMYRNGDKFYNYDFGEEDNLIHYGSITPRKYNLGNVKTPTYIFSGDSDGFATQNDVQILIKQLPNVKLHHKVDIKGFAHLDFILGVNADKFLNEEILAVMNSL